MYVHLIEMIHIHVSLKLKNRSLSLNPRGHRLDYYVQGFGTGGTFAGAGRALREPRSLGIQGSVGLFPVSLVR